MKAISITAASGFRRGVIFIAPTACYMEDPYQICRSHCLLVAFPPSSKFLAIVARASFRLLPGDEDRERYILTACQNWAVGELAKSADDLDLFASESPLLECVENIAIALAQVGAPDDKRLSELSSFFHDNLERANPVFEAVKVLRGSRFRFETAELDD